MCMNYKWSTDTNILVGGQWCTNYEPQSCILLLLLYIHVLHLPLHKCIYVKKKTIYMFIKKRYL